MNEQNSIKYTFQSLRAKQIINAEDGGVLGHATDLELSEDCSKIRALLLPAYGNLFTLIRREPMRIPIGKIESIGEDVILVRLNRSDEGFK